MGFRYDPSPSCKTINLSKTGGRKGTGRSVEKSRDPLSVSKECRGRGLSEVTSTHTQSKTTISNNDLGESESKEVPTKKSFLNRRVGSNSVSTYPSIKKRKSDIGSRMWRLSKIVRHPTIRTGI